MKRLTFRTENQWRSLRDGGSVEIVQLAFVWDEFHVGVSLVAAGFGFGLAYWRKAMLTYPQWEPIETNGWAGPVEVGPTVHFRGEPFVPDQGKEHAP